MKNKSERAELLQQFKEIKIEAGVYQIKNKASGKIFIGSLSNLKSLNGIRMQLAMGSFSNKQLQQEWTAQGEQGFTIDVLEVLKPSDNPFVVMKDELRKLEEHWLDKLQPFGEQGYIELK